MRTTTTVLAALLLLAPVLPAQEAAPLRTDSASFFRAMQWKNIGPNRGGRSLAISGSPSRPLEYYFGAVGGGLWKTTDGGLNWHPVTDHQLHSSSVGAVAVAESNPDVVYIGMGETEFRGNIMQGDGVYKSSDAGKTWKHIGLAQTQAIARVRVDPTNADIVYVAALGHPYAPNVERGVFRSKDGGVTWTRVLFRNDSTGAVDLVIDRTNPKVLYAAFWQVYRTPWKMWGGGPGSGLFKSTDGGDTWTELTRNPGMPAGIIGKIGVAVSPADPNRVYAIVEAEQGGVFRSDDGGATWRLMNAERKIRQRAFYYSRIYADPKNPDRVYALNTSMYRSDDGGRTFPTVVRDPHGDNHDLWIDPTNPDRLANSNDGGGNVSTNGGKTWTDQFFPTAQAYRVEVTKDLPYHVCGAQQDNTTFCLPSSNWVNLHVPFPRGGSMSWPWYTPGDYYYDVGGGESGYIAPDPVNPDIFYAGSQGALLTRYNRRTGEIRDVQVYPRFFSGEPASALPERWQWTYPIVFSPLNPKVLYTSSQHLWKTTNQGQSWTRISPDLTRNDPSTTGMSGGPITMDMNGPEIYATIFTVAPSKFDSMTIWTGSDDGLAHITRDGGASWTNITPKDLPPFSRISLIDASPHHPGTAWLAAKRYQLDDRAPYIYRTTDYGATWTRITAGLRADDYVHAVREDHQRAGLLYAGTEHGVYVSFNAGDRWERLSLNLPDVQVPDLQITERDLVIATHGRSMWILRDLEPIRQHADSVARAAAHLYQPRDGIRNAYQPVFQYTLGAEADSLLMEVLDGNGRVIRTFANSARQDATRDSLKQARAVRDSLIKLGRAEPDTCAVPDYVPPAPGRKTGINRFEWDGRYPGATVFSCMVIWSGAPEQGPVAPPGTYQVRLTANGVSQTRRFSWARDPRWTATDQDLVAQFELGLKIRDQVSAANEAVIGIRAIRAGITNALAAKPDRRLRQSADRLLPVLKTVEEALYQVRNRSGQDPLNFPIKLNNRLAALGSSVATGDARPTDASYVVFKELSDELAGHLRKLNTALTAELPQVNERLTALRLEPLSIGRFDRPFLKIP
jgi:photosystem II stability/assembly factor-like uncharacterized protein